MKTYHLLLAASVFAASISALAGSTIRVINNTDHYVQAIWQAGGCAEVVYDWADDRQYTVCEAKMITPMDDASYDFGLFHSDRSVKVFLQDGERIAYCNSMDDSSITLSRGEGKVNVSYDC